MKTLKKVVFTLFFEIVLVIMMSKVTCIAKENYKESIKKFMDDIGSFEYMMLTDQNFDYGKVKITKNIMARAAALSVKSQSYVAGDIDETGEEFYSFDKSEFLTAGKNLFGKKVQLKWLSSEKKSWGKDSYKDKQYGYVIAYGGDHVKSFETFDINIKKKGKGYIVKKTIYYGHWMFTDDGPTHIVTYTVKKSEKSEYGYIITGIKWEKIKEEDRKGYIKAKQLKYLKSAKVGDIVKFGDYEQDDDFSNGTEPLEWIVLSKDKEKMLLLSKYAIDCQPYNSKAEYATWETCSLRKWLNEVFYSSAFSNEEKTVILQTKLKNQDNPNNGTSGGKDTKDNVFLLSIDEITNPKYGFSSNSGVTDISRRCAPTQYAYDLGVQRSDFNYDFVSSGVCVTEDGEDTCWWWLRSPGIEGDRVADVDADGTVFIPGRGISWLDMGVRPALYVKI